MARPGAKAAAKQMDDNRTARINSMEQSEIIRFADNTALSDRTNLPFSYFANPVNAKEKEIMYEMAGKLLKTAEFQQMAARQNYRLNRKKGQHMNLPITVTQEDLLEILLNVAPNRPVFIWGAPGIGKSALVEQFAEEMGLPCVSLLDDLHPWVIDYIIQRPDHLFSEPPRTEEPFSTPRSWHMLSDALTEYGAGKRELSGEMLKMLSYGCLITSHAGMFLAYTKSLKNSHMLEDIINEKAKFPSKPEARFYRGDSKRQLQKEIENVRTVQKKKVVFLLRMDCRIFAGMI